jgi:hypothetical protein
MTSSTRFILIAGRELLDLGLNLQRLPIEQFGHPRKWSAEFQLRSQIVEVDL